MKKVMFFAAALFAVVAFSSCQKECTCSEASTGISEKVKTDNQYPTCKSIQDELNSETEAIGGDELGIKWKCN